MPISSIIDLLGGIRPAARKLGHSTHTTVQGWKERGSIPTSHWPRIIDVASSEGVELTAEHFLGWTPLPVKSHDNDNPKNESAHQ